MGAWSLCRPRSKANKLLPRTTVLDRLKADVGGKEPDRCLALLGEREDSYD